MLFRLERKCLTQTAILFQERLLHEDFSKFQPLKPRLIQNVDKMLAEDIARLMAMIPLEEKQNMMPKGWCRI